MAITAGSLRRAAAIFFSILSLNCGAATQSSRPNIILILADDLGFSGTLGCYGSRRFRRPTWTRWRQAELRFLTHFYNTPRCCPSRAALLTGLYPQQAGIGNMMEDRGIAGIPRRVEPTIASRSRKCCMPRAIARRWSASGICAIFFSTGKSSSTTNRTSHSGRTKPTGRCNVGFERTIMAPRSTAVSSYYDPFSLVRG